MRWSQAPLSSPAASRARGQIAAIYRLTLKDVLGVKNDYLAYIDNAAPVRSSAFFSAIMFRVLWSGVARLRCTPRRGTWLGKAEEWRTTKRRRGRRL